MSEIDVLNAEIGSRTAKLVKANGLLENARLKNSELKVEVERLRKDAARYRWLREQNAAHVDEDNQKETFYVGMEDGTDDFGWVGADLDEAIDAAMKEPK